MSLTVKSVFWDIWQVHSAESPWSQAPSCQLFSPPQTSSFLNGSLCSAWPDNGCIANHGKTGKRGSGLNYIRFNDKGHPLLGTELLVGNTCSTTARLNTKNSQSMERSWSDIPARSPRNSAQEALSDEATSRDNFENWTSRKAHRHLCNCIFKLMFLLFDVFFHLGTNS